MRKLETEENPNFHLYTSVFMTIHQEVTYESSTKFIPNSMNLKPKIYGSSQAQKKPIQIDANEGRIRP